MTDFPKDIKIAKNRPLDPSTRWFVVDWDGEYFINNNIPHPSGGCCVYTLEEKQSQDLELSAYSPKICSEDPLKLTSLLFKKNAWRKPNLRQCDAVLYPTAYQPKDAILFVELKYNLNETYWETYKKHAIKQIEDTIDQLSKHCSSLKERTLYGLISHPLLLSKFGGATSFSPIELSKIYKRYKLHIHVGNYAKFQGTQTISFIEETET